MKQINRTNYIKGLLLFMIVTMVACSGGGDMEKDYLYFTDAATIRIKGVYVDENPMVMTIYGDTLYDGYFSVVKEYKPGSKIDLSSTFMLNNREKDLTLKVIDAVTKKELFSAPFQVNGENVHTLDFAWLYGKNHKEYKTINITIEILNFTANEFTVETSNAQLPRGKGQASEITAFREGSETFFPLDYNEIITVTIVDGPTGKTLGTKKIDISKIEEESYNVGAVIVPSGSFEVKLEDPVPPVADATINKVGIYLKSDTGEPYDITIVDENFEPLGVLGQNIIPNQWAYLDVTFDTLINGYYYVVFYKAGTEEPYKGGDINSSFTSGDEYGTPLFPTDGSKGSVRCFFIYEQYGGLRGMQL